MASFDRFVRTGLYGHKIDIILSFFPNCHWLRSRPFAVLGLNRRIPMASQTVGLASPTGLRCRAGERDRFKNRPSRSKSSCEEKMMHAYFEPETGKGTTVYNRCPPSLIVR